MARCQHGKRFLQQSKNQAFVPSELIHSNLVGPLLTPSLSGSNFFVVFINDFLQKSWIYFMSSKAKTFIKFKFLKQLIEGETNGR
jgi:hypothetical protein